MSITQTPLLQQPKQMVVYKDNSASKTESPLKKLQVVAEEKRSYLSSKVDNIIMSLHSRKASVQPVAS